MDLTGARWRKSSFSEGNGAGCVELAFLAGGGVAVRDTKDRSRAPHLYTTTEWHAFLAGVRAAEFDAPHP